MEFWGTLEAHQGPWGHHKTGILDLAGKNKYCEQLKLPKVPPSIKKGRGLLRGYTERLLSGGNVSMGFSSPQVTENSFQITRRSRVIWKEFFVTSGEEKSILTFPI